MRPSRCVSPRARVRVQRLDTKPFFHILGIVEPRLRVRVERFLVALQRQDAVPALAGDQLRRGALRVHRVPGDERVLQLQHLQQRRQRPDLVGLRVDRHLAEHDPGPRSEGADQMQRRALLGAQEDAPEHLAVDRDLPDAAASGILAHSKANRDSDFASGSGSIIRNSRENASWLGVPCSKRMNWRRNASLFFA